jgi:site-specific recombinase XerD
MERYLKSRRTDARESSIKSWRYRLKLFVEWCEREEIEDVSQLDGWVLDEYEAYRRGEGLSSVTLNSEFQTLKNWLEYLARIDVVDDALPEKVKVPPVQDGDETNDEFLPADRARAILTSYRSSTTRFAGSHHTAFELLWFTGARVGAIQGLDVRDYHSDDAYVVFRHRPDTGTPLKNGTRGERAVAIPEPVTEILDAYVASVREDGHDEYGRQPLLTTARGRTSENSLRVWSYLATQPCLYQDCPHGHERATCDYVHVHEASKCPSSMSPHRIRTGSITWQRDSGLPAEIVSERVNASLEVIEQYYDQATAEQRMEQRRRPYIDRLTFDTDA